MPLSPASPRSLAARIWLGLALAAVLGLGGLLRFAYYDTAPGMVDEEITTAVVRHMRQSGDWDTNWIKADVPPEMRYNQYNFSSHLYATFYFYRLVKLVPGTLAWRSERDGFLVYRFLVALCATAVLGQTLQLGRRTGGWTVGLGAALLTGVVPLLVQDAHYVRPEAFTTVLTLGAVALCWPDPAKRFSPARTLGAALCIGLLVASKISMLALLWLPGVPLLTASLSLARKLGWALATLLVVAFGFALGAPGAVAHPAQFWEGVQHLSKQYAWLHPPHSHFNPTPVGDMMLAYFGATFGWALLVFFGVGVVVLARRRWVEALLLAGPVFLFVAYFATRSVFFERNLSHVVPLAGIVAAYGVVATARWIAAKLAFSPRIAAGTLLAALALQPTVISRAHVFSELSGRAAEIHQRFEDELRERHRDADWHGELYFTTEAHQALGDRWKTTSRPIVIRITDYRDERTARGIDDLKRRFRLEEVATSAGTFPSLPTCTLLTYHSPTMRYYRATGERAP